MTARYYRYLAQNDSGATSNVTISERPWGIDASTGNKTWGAEATLMAATTVASSASAASTAVDNSTTGYLGSELSVSATGTGTAGVLTIFLEFATDDAGANFPTAGTGIPIGSLNAGESFVPMTA